MPQTIRITLTNPLTGQWTGPGRDDESTVLVADDVVVRPDSDYQELADRLRPHVTAFLAEHHPEALADVYVSAWDPAAVHLGDPVPGGKELCNFAFGAAATAGDVSTTTTRDL